MNRAIVRYRLSLAAKRAAAPLLGLASRPVAAPCPPVTLFIIATNNRYPLELTLRSLVKYTDYPDYRIVVADNGCTDGTTEFLAAEAESLGVQVVRSEERRGHGDWLDYIAREAETPFWFGIDDDMIFLARDWLSDMMRRFIERDDLYLVGAERVPPTTGTVEPVSERVTDGAEHPSTWLFGIRSSFRDQIGDSFLFHKGEESPKTGHLVTYDTGGRILERMRALGLAYDYMPAWFRMKYHHIGHLSWIFLYRLAEPIRLLKEHQLEDIRRRVDEGRW